MEVLPKVDRGLAAQWCGSVDNGWMRRGVIRAETSSARASARMSPVVVARTAVMADGSSCRV